MPDKDDMNPYRPPEAELRDPQIVEKESVPFDAALSLSLIMFVAFIACLFCGPYKSLQWVHHVCFLIFFLYSINRWRKSHSRWFLIPTVVSIGLWGMLDAISFAP